MDGFRTDDVWQDDTMATNLAHVSVADDQALEAMMLEERALDELLLKADRLAADLQNFSQSEDGSRSILPDESFDESYAPSMSVRGGDALSADHESLRERSLHTSNDHEDVDDMLRKVDTLVTEIRRSTSGDFTSGDYDNINRDVAQVQLMANEDDEVEDMLQRAELLAAKMYTVSQSSLDMVDDDDDYYQEDGQNIYPLMLRKRSKSSSEDYSISADTGENFPHVFEQAGEILKCTDAVSNDGTTTSMSLGSDMAVASRVVLSVDDRVNVNHAQRVAKAEEMARLMQEALSSHMPIEDTSDLLHVNESNEDVFERVVSALRKTASEDEKEEKIEMPDVAEGPKLTSTQIPYDDPSLAASDSIRSESMRSGSMRSSSMRSGSLGFVPPPPQAPPLPQSSPPTPAPPTITQEILPTEQDSNFVPVADFRPKKATPQPPPRKMVDDIPRVISPPPPRRTPRPASISADDDDFVPVADFSSFGSGRAGKEKALEPASSPRSVRWEKVERAYQQDEDFVPLMDFRNSVPKQRAVQKSIAVLPKVSRKARRRKLVRGTLAMLAICYVAWRLFAAWKSPPLACPRGADPSQCAINNAALDLTNDTFDLVQDGNDTDEATPIELESQVRIIWDNPANTCHVDDEGLSLEDEMDGECEIIDLTKKEDAETPIQRKGGLQLPPFVCNIPHLSKLLARHCRHLST